MVNRSFEFDTDVWWDITFREIEQKRHRVRVLIIFREIELTNEIIISTE